MADYSNAVIAFGDLKEALLYFDYVLPVNEVGSVLKVFPKDAFDGGTREVWKYLTKSAYPEFKDALPKPDGMLAFWPPRLVKEPEFHLYFIWFRWFLFTSMVKSTLGEDAYKKFVYHLATSLEANPDVTNHLPPVPTLEELRRKFAQIVKQFELEDMDVDCTTFSMPDDSRNPENPSLSFQNVPLVDTDNISFSQIIEFRKDKETMNKMRRFRLFAYSNYQGKCRAFVEDDEADDG